MANTSNNAKVEAIDITRLSLDQLGCLKQDMESELGKMQDSLNTLHGCKGKYAGSKEALEAFQPSWESREILVPLTSSMYVPGRIKDMNSFVIDIGTGYYIEKDLDGTKDYFKRRVDYVQEQIEKIEKLAKNKTRLYNSVAGVFEEKQVALKKMMQQQQQQQPQAGKQSA